MSKTKKIICAVAAVVLVAVISVVGTIAYLNSKASIKNVFTVGKVSIDFTETGAVSGVNSYAYLPGDTITKDAVVTVDKSSEDAYVFVELKKDTLFASSFTYTMDETAAWKPLGGSYTNVYYVVYTKNTVSDTQYHVFKNDQVVAGSNISTGAADTSVTIYTGAIQKGNLASATAAWTALTNGTGTLVQ